MITSQNSEVSAHDNITELIITWGGCPLTAWLGMKEDNDTGVQILIVFVQHCVN